MYIYQIIDYKSKTRGLFEDLEASKDASIRLHEESKLTFFVDYEHFSHTRMQDIDTTYFQINKIPVNTIVSPVTSYRIWCIGKDGKYSY